MKTDKSQSGEAKPSKKSTAKQQKEAKKPSETKKTITPSSKETAATTAKKQKKSTGTKSTAKQQKETTSVQEEELEETMSEQEIESFEIQGRDMEKLTSQVCDILFDEGKDEGIEQKSLLKRLKLSNRDGARLSLKLERQGLIKREKILDNGRWTYMLKISKMPVDTKSIEAAPCLVCPVEQQCTLEGEVSPRTCQYIEQWVISELGSKKSKHNK